MKIKAGIVAAILILMILPVLGTAETLNAIAGKKISTIIGL